MGSKVDLVECIGIARRAFGAAYDRLMSKEKHRPRDGKRGQRRGRR